MNIGALIFLKNLFTTGKQHSNIADYLIEKKW